MVVICPNCSNVDYDKLKLVVGEENIDCCCMGYCSQSDDQTVGYINGEFVQTYSEDEFLKKCEEAK